MTSEEQFAEQRERNRTAYAIEDFYDARKDLRYAASGNLVLAAIVSLGLLSGADNLTHVGAALATGATVLIAGRYAEMERLTYLYALLAAYVIALGAEYAYAGLPAPPLPYLTVENGWVGFLPFANSLSPLLYILARAGLIYPLINLLLRRRTLADQPMSVVRQLDRDLASKLS